jgi:hypothetical protein
VKLQVRGHDEVLQAWGSLETRAEVQTSMVFSAFMGSLYALNALAAEGDTAYLKTVLLERAVRMKDLFDGIKATMEEAELLLEVIMKRALELEL